ncbi:hypothetical protein LMG28614_05628 [Paraburkholderia ultramafica]|uniref:Uncharacterized protein n=1 Tax=Paraburkholderia ultramafica TaxID=1544867 RepID=A0A6S7BJI2_9BURK|nr:hypothetical protein LMG28614_05628 [Paraburkholderia ultramafica]
MATHNHVDRLQRIEDNFADFIAEGFKKCDCSIRSFNRKP